MKIHLIDPQTAHDSALQKMKNSSPRHLNSKQWVKLLTNFLPDANKDGNQAILHSSGVEIYYFSTL